MEKITLTEDELEFKLCHSSAGAHNSAYEGFYNLLMTEAAEQWKNDRPEVAEALKRFAKNKIGPLKEAASKKLNEYIEESKKRR